MHRIRLRGEWPKSGFFGPSGKRQFQNISRNLCKITQDYFYDVQIEAQGKHYPQVMMQLHPANGPLIISMDLKNRLIEIRAMTIANGPGYHAFVAEVARKLGEAMKIKWSEVEDSTGFYESGDFAALQKAFLLELQRMARILIQRRDKGEKMLGLWMPSFERFPAGGVVNTTMGPRGQQWLEAAASEPQRCIDVFSWWKRETDVDYHHKRAMAFLWFLCRWRPPFIEEEQKWLSAGLDALDRAHELDPHRELPWREWLFFVSMIDGHPKRQMLEEKAAQVPADKPLIGYRRKDYLMVMGNGFHIRFDAEFAYMMEDEDQFKGWGKDRTIRVGFPIEPSEDAEEPPVSLEMTDEQLNALLPKIDDSDSSVERLQKKSEHGWTVGLIHPFEGHFACMVFCYDDRVKTMALVTAEFDDPLDRAWARQLFKTIGFNPELAKSDEEWE